ncbi:MAG: hypothetical protein ACRDAQ_12480 [Cetobacterium sp.]
MYKIKFFYLKKFKNIVSVDNSPEVIIPKINFKGKANNKNNSCKYLCGKKWKENSDRK